MAVLLMPLMFTRPEEELTFTLYLFKSVTSVAMLLVFYVNFLWLVPKLIETDDKMKFVFINFFVIIVGAIIMMKMRGFEFRYIDMARHFKPRHTMSMPPFYHVLIVLRDGLNLILSTLIAYSIRMTEHAHRQNHLRQEAEVAKREAELRGLRFQISPHFLLNTLNNIYALTAFNQQKAQDAILELSGMLRHILYDNQQDFVRLDDEIKFIHSYINLMKIRIPKTTKIQIDVNVPKDTELRIAPLIFISLIENAFKHGIGTTADSFIHINIHADCNHIACEIENSNFPKKDTDRSGHGIGLEQVGKRLELAYHKKYTWEKGTKDNNKIYYSNIYIYDTKLRDN